MKNSQKGFIVPLLVVVVILVLGIIGFQFYKGNLPIDLIQNTGTHMEPAIMDGERLTLDKVGVYNRSDIILIDTKGLLKADSSITRIIGLPNETVQIDGEKITIYNTSNPDGLVIKEQYVFLDPSVASSTSVIFQNIHKKVTLGPNEYWVMGDNRYHSADSVLFGPISQTRILGIVKKI